MEYGTFFVQSRFKPDYSFEKESDVYKMEEYGSFEPVRYGSGHHSITLDFEKIFARNYPAVCRLFVSNYHFSLRI